MTLPASVERAVQGDQSEQNIDNSCIISIFVWFLVKENFYCFVFNKKKVVGEIIWFPHLVMKVYLFGFVF